MNRLASSTESAEGSDRGGNERQAALLVHAMSARDRTWLLAALPARQRATLEGLLAELADLGIPADPELLAQARIRREPEPATMAADPAACDEPPEVAAIRKTSASALAQVLAQEPAELIARLLAMHDWPWEAAFLHRLNDSLRRDVQSRRMHASDRPTVVAAPTPANHGNATFDVQLLALLCQRLAREPLGAARERDALGIGSGADGPGVTFGKFANAGSWRGWSRWRRANRASLRESTR